MANSSEKIDITEFSDYKKVPGQYRDSFIIGSRCVKLNEDEKVVTVAYPKVLRKKNLFWIRFMPENKSLVY